MRQRISLIVFCILIVGLIGVFGWNNFTKKTPQRQRPTPTATLTATVASVSGTATLTHAGSSSSPATVGDVVQSGDVIETGADGNVSIEFFSSDRTAVDSNSRVLIEEATIDANDARIQKVKVALFAGRVWSRVFKLLDVNAAYEASYNGVVTNVRGTAFLLSVKNRQLSIDEFDGVVGVSGSSTALVYPGFSFLNGTISPTPDSVRNDHWIRQQLRADREFATRVKKQRRELGSDESFDSIGNEAGPFSLDERGAVHSSYQTLRIISPDKQTALRPGASTDLLAEAIFTETSGTVFRDVTTDATWQISDPSLATIDRGRLTASPNASGTVTIVARWNDGTHEHSGSTTLTIGAAMEINTTTELLINGQPIR